MAENALVDDAVPAALALVDDQIPESKPFVLEAGGWIDVEVSDIRADGTVYAQPVAKTEDLGEMCGNLSNVYDGGKGTPLPLHKVTVVSGMRETDRPRLYCAAKFSDDNCWYRALLGGRTGPSTCNVTFIDYGNQAEAQIGELRELEASFRADPGVAIRIKLPETLPGLPGSRETLVGAISALSTTGQTLLSVTRVEATEPLPAVSGQIHFKPHQAAHDDDLISLAQFLGNELNKRA